MIDTQIQVQEAGSKLFPDNQAVFRALSDSQFIPFFQPLVTLRTGQLAGFEVLARWKHPTDGMIPPDRFIPLAERDGWIGELTRQILKKALHAAAAVPGSFTIAFNVSALQLRDLSLPDQIREIALEADFPLARLIVEITESALIDDMHLAVVVVAELKAMGCKLALDDFGTGYSSLRSLQSLPFDKLKVDRSFVNSMTVKRESRKIVSAVVGLGQSLGLLTVAEGIETQEQAEMMIWLGCELGQGYFFGRPMPLEDLAACVAMRRVALIPDSSRVKGTSRSNLDFSLSQRLAQVQAVYDGAPVGLGFLDQNLRFVNLNKKLAEINGGSVESHLGLHMSETNPEIFPFLEPFLRRSLAGEAFAGIEVINSVTGEMRLVNYQPALDEGNEVVGIVVSISDVTDRLQSEIDAAISDSPSKSKIAVNAHSPWRMGPNLQHPSASSARPISEDAPLKSYEKTALTLIAACSSETGITIGELAREMHKLGLVQATSLAVNSLRRRDFIVRQAVPGMARNAKVNAANLLLAPAGQRWLEKNQAPVVEPINPILPSIEGNSLIDLLSTLRFRG